MQTEILQVAYAATGSLHCRFGLVKAGSMAAKRRRNLLDSVLADSVSQICVLDADRRIRYFSVGMEQATGWKSDDVEGLICDLAVPDSSSSTDLLTSGLAPAAEVFDGRTVTVASVLPKSNGNAWPTILTFLPVLDSDNQVVRIVVSANEHSIPDSSRESMTQRLHAEITAIRLKTRKQFSEASYIGNSSQIQRALDQADLLKNSDVGYSIIGPPGSGRQHLARLIHVGGQHAEHSFAPIECRLLTLDSMRDTLRRLKRVADSQTRSAHQRTGTLALIDVDHCPREIQTWVLKNVASEQHEIRLTGISTQPLDDVVQAEWMLPEFRDLLSAVRIQLPSLHHRGHDLELLAQSFVEQSQRTQQTSAESISAEVFRQFRFYRWPGNVRELRQVIFAACEACFEKVVAAEHLPFSFRAGIEAQNMPHEAEPEHQSLEQMLKAFESDVLLKTLDACDGNKADAARRLGMTRPRLYRRLKTLGLVTDDTDSQSES